jgi:hypothetical protein
MKVKVFYSIILIALSVVSLYAQNPSKIEKLIPSGVSNVKEMIQPMPSFMVRVEYTGNITETTSCSSGSFGDIKTALSWYNTNDETGNMMVGMVSAETELKKNWQKNKDELEEIRQQTGSQTIVVSEVTEEVISGGRLYMLNIKTPCVESGKSESQLVYARCFFFNGNTQGEIRIETRCSPGEVKAMVGRILEEVKSFNFSGLI